MDVNGGEIRFDLTLGDGGYDDKLTAAELRMQRFKSVKLTEAAAELRKISDANKDVAAGVNASGASLQRQGEHLKKSTSLWSKMASAASVAANVYTVASAISTMRANKLAAAGGGGGAGGKELVAVIRNEGVSARLLLRQIIVPLDQIVKLLSSRKRPSAPAGGGGGGGGGEPPSGPPAPVAPDEPGGGGFGGFNLSGLLGKLKGSITSFAPALAPLLTMILPVLAVVAALYVAFKAVSAVISTIASVAKLAFGIVVGVIKAVWAVAKTAFAAIAFIGEMAFKAIGVAARAAGEIAQAVFEQMRNGFEFNAAQEQSRVTFKLFAGTGDATKDAQKALDIMRQINKEGLLAPVKTDDLVKSATRILPIVQGNTERMLYMLRIAERMSASTPGTTVEQATEAILDYQVSGEKERLKEFNINAKMLEEAGASGAAGIDAVLNKQGRSLEVVRAQAQTYTGLMSSIASFIDQVRGAFSETFFERSKVWMTTVVDWISSNGMAALEYAKQLGTAMSAWIDDIVNSKGPGLLQWAQTAAMTVLTWYEYVRGAIASQNLKATALDWLRQTLAAAVEIALAALKAGGSMAWEYASIGIDWAIGEISKKLLEWVMNKNPIGAAINAVGKALGKDDFDLGKAVRSQLGVDTFGNTGDVKARLATANENAMAQMQGLGSAASSAVTSNYRGIGTRTFNALGMSAAPANAQQHAAAIQAYAMAKEGQVQSGFAAAKQTADAADAAAEARLAQEGSVTESKKLSLKDALKAAKGQTGYHLRITSLDGSFQPAGLT